MDDNFYYEYWIGKDIDLEKYWSAYFQGDGYKHKFLSMKCHVSEITFEVPNKNQPLFNLEPIFKTIKAYYHDLKKDCLSTQQYNSAGPMFIYEINRGSGIWTWLGELPYLLLYGTTLTAEQIKGQRIDNLEKKLKILKEYFGDRCVNPEIYQAFMNAQTPNQMERAMQNLFNERIKSIKISKNPVLVDVEDSKKEMIDLKEIFKSLK